MSKTPQFDKAIAEYFSKLELDEKGGQWRTCRFSGERFYVRPEDIEFYKKMQVPLPTITPHERIRRRIAQQNAYHLFHATSTLTGKRIISMFPPGSPYKIYEHESFYGEQWDPFAFAFSCDPGKSFFEQYHQFQLNLPHPNLTIRGKIVNSDYNNSSRDLKNCYLILDSVGVEDSAYGMGFFQTRECMEGFTLFNCSQSYDCLEGTNLYRCRYADFAVECIDCAFLYDCRDCESCFCSVNLRHKKYCFMNEQLSKEGYRDKMKSINLGNRDEVAKWKGELEKLKAKAIYKENHNDRSINSFGDFIKDCKNCYGCFYMIGCENVAYSIGGLTVRDSMDLEGGMDTQFCYESFGGNKNFSLKFCFWNQSSRELEFCENCTNCINCFACEGLKNKSFCIFNKQYTEQEYWVKIDELKTAMLKRGEYGEFFPPEYTQAPYNICMANAFSGYDDIETAKKYGYRVEDIPESSQDTISASINAEDLPTDIRDVKDSILQEVVLDTVNNKKFRFTNQELQFYRRFNIPLPQIHPSVRLENYRRKFGPVILKFFERECMKCGKQIQSVYPTDDPKIVYCERCYQQEIA
ncbi:MAG: hypothetical protein AAB420_04145 [Patescibacteria group bacterium]